ncbi:hypothetical protein HL653_14785 [Sphingomonas sp. AP4-R1]|uniref:sensor histidine kinase n=1 Tax=Sphingomonas sp. AP4-R1 TaxID=2735134 RepID=UPI0014934FDD|nr:ATP-binding protein [Sphingomonas sp. AP4-R1]QJU58866.1 hypothetical protein HL653_14785 [Sphingomonas sp. AP4-R1]
MNPGSANKAAERASFLPEGLFSVAALAAVASLAGWVENWPELRGFGIPEYPDWPLTALSNILLSIALLLTDRVPQSVRRGLLAVPIGIAAIALLEYGFRTSFGLDALLFPSQLRGIGLPQPGRPGLVPVIALISIGVAAWRVGDRSHPADTNVFLLACAMVGLSATSIALLMLETGLTDQTTRLAASLPASVASLAQAGGILVWLGLRGRGLPAATGRSRRLVNLAFVAVLILPAILLPIQVKLAQIAFAPKLTTEIVASALNLLIVVGLLGWTIERLSREQSALQQLNAEYAHSARLNAMGEMASSLAHELNQPLAATANYLGAAKIMVATRPDDPDVAQLLDAANAQLLRTGEIIRRLRDFIARRDVELRAEDLAQVIPEAASLALVGRGEILTNYLIRPAARRVLVDRIQIQQVLVNIMRNAAEAVKSLPPDERTIDVTTQNAQTNFVEVAVCDHGRGFPARVLAGLQASRPFPGAGFLGEKGSDGLGVGLSISRRIVEAHGGRLIAWNNADRGATVAFTLPLYHAMTDIAA